MVYYKDMMPYTPMNKKVINAKLPAMMKKKDMGKMMKNPMKRMMPTPSKKK